MSNVIQFPKKEPEASYKGVVEVVVEHRKVVRVTETYSVLISIDGELISQETMPGGAAGKTCAEEEVRMATERYDRHGYKVRSSSVSA